MHNKLAERGTPRRLLRLLLRLPIALYRLRLGWLLGDRFLMLTNVGRSTGRVRRTVLEVVRFEPQQGGPVVASGWGERANWFRNAQANSDVVVDIGRRHFAARAVRLTVNEASKCLYAYARSHPVAFREITRLVTGRNLATTEEVCRSLAELAPLVEFEPKTRET